MKTKAEKNEISEREAKQEVLEDLFHDMYKNRLRIYKVNFVRGLFFGAGGALAGAFVLAILAWILTFFVNIPLIGELFKDVQQTVEQSTQKVE